GSQVLDLDATRYHLIALTLRGRGQGDTDPTGPYVFTDYGRDIRQATRRLGLNRIAFVGASLGGMLALPYAAEHGGRWSASSSSTSVPSSGETDRAPTTRACSRRRRSSNPWPPSSGGCGSGASTRRFPRRGWRSLCPSTSPRHQRASSRGGSPNGCARCSDGT